MPPLNIRTRKLRSNPLSGSEQGVLHIHTHTHQTCFGIFFSINLICLSRIFMKTLFIRTLVYDNLLAYVNMSKINFIKLMIVLTSVCRFYLCKTTTLVIIPKPSLYLNVVFGIRRFHTQVKGPRGHQCSQLHLHQHPKGTSKRMPATKKDERRHGDPCWGRPLLDK